MKKTILFNLFKNTFKLLPLFTALIISYTIQAQCVITSTSPSVSICGNSMTMVSVTAAGTGLSYLWNNGNTTDSFNTSVSGTYQVTVSGACGIAAVSSPIVVTKVNCALDFDGAGDLSFTTSPLTTQIDNITMETWIKWDGTTTQRQVIAYNGTGNNGYGIVINKFDGDKVTIQIGTSTFLTSNLVLTIGVWTHLAITRDNGTWNMYVNGTPETLSSQVATPTTPASYFTMGSNITGFTNYKGQIDEFRFWTRALSEAEISTNMSRTTVGTELGLLAYYNFDQGIAEGNNTSESILLDRTGTAENSNLSGFNLTGTTSNFVASPYTSIGNWVGPLPTITGITTVPSVGICPGSSITITSTVIGSAPFTYQWHFENFPFQVAIPNATLPGLAFTNVNTSYNGTYYLVVTNAAGSVTSAGINFNVGCNNALGFDGVNDVVNLGNLNYISAGVPGEYTIEAMVNFPSYGDYWIFGDEQVSNNGVLLQINNTGNIWTYQPTAGIVVSTVTAPLNTWTHIALVQNQKGVKLFVNGVFRQQLLSASNLHSETTNNSYIGAFQGTSRYLAGSIDEVRIWSHALSDLEILTNVNRKPTSTQAGLYAYYDFNQGIAGNLNTTINRLQDRTLGNYIGTLSGFALNNNASNWVNSTTTISGSWITFAPSIAGISSLNTTVCAGGMTVFNSTVLGTTPLAYQWLRNGLPISGANSNSLTLSGIVSSTTGTYSLRASNMLGTVTSSNLAISLVGTNLIEQPVSQTICGGALASFTISATGVQNYLWSNGATTPTMNTSLTGSYRVTISGACGSIISSTVTLATTLGISISTHPASQTICGSSLANINVNASGSGLVYLWNTGQTTAGFNTSILGNYMVTVSGACGTPQVSNVANVSAGIPISIHTQPVSSTVCGGSLASFAISATGVQNYLWSNGATTPTMNTSLTGSYRVTVTGVCGSIISSNAILTSTLGISIIAQPVSQTICGSSLANINVSATGTGLTYLWNTGQTNAEFITSTAGNYIVTVSGTCGAPIVSNVATITSLQTITIVTQPQPNAICGLGLANFMVSATGSNIKYLWNNGATTSGINTSIVGSYMVTLSGSCINAIVSNSASLTVGMPTQILTQPQGGTYCEGNVASIFVSATGSNLSYLWSFGSPLASNTGPTSLSDAGDKYVTVTGSCGVVVSNAATFIINPKPSITTTASNLKVCYGEMATLSASGANTLVWQPTNITGSEITVGGTNTGVAIITVTGTDANNCSGFAFVNVTTLSPIITTADYPVKEYCLKDTLIYISASSTVLGISNGFLNLSVAGLGMKNVNNTFETPDGCKFDKSSGINIINCTTTGINESTPNSSISIAPNPAASNGELSIKSSDLIMQINLLNLSGRVVFTSTSKSQNATIRLDNITSGMYLIELLTTKEKVVRKLVIE